MIQGKVARILNSREVAINRGSTNGVKVGMKFDIMSDKKEDIRDPDTNEVLGSIDRPKVRVTISYVEEKVAVASTYKKTRVNVGGTGGAFVPFGARDPLMSSFSRALSPPKWVERVETLKTSEQTWEDLDESESYVKTGDPVVQVAHDD